jgi:lysyl-tRNA synthetase class 2
MWHSDLHSGNIFVENNKIVSIIDWQGCMGLPLFLTCKIPKFLRFNGPLLFDLPPAAGLTTQEKKEKLLRYQLTQLQRFYISKFKDLDNTIFQALSYPHAVIRRQLIDFAGSTWEDEGLFFFREMMHQLWRDWDEITIQADNKCPITFTSDELSSHVAERKVWDEYKELFDSLGIPIDGWVHSEDFKLKAETMRNLVTEILSSADNREEVRRALRAWKLSDPGSTHLSSNVMDI